MTPWDQVLGHPSPLTKSFCGENRYVGVENFLEFYITAGCLVEVEPRDSIHAKVRMEWTLAEFYADGGVTRFVDRLAGVLGIHRSRIKTVACYEGSVIVDFFITSELQSEEDDAPEEVQDEIDELQQQIITVLESGDAEFGAPVLGVEGNDKLLFGNAIPKGPVTGGAFGESTAIRIDDNIWDRYQRIQEIIEKQKDDQIEEDKSLFGDDSGKSASAVQKSEQIIIEVESADSIQATETIKFTILIIAALILVGLVITAFCIYKCFTKQRRNVEDIIKAQEKAHEQRQDEAPSQFAPKGDDSLFTSTFYNTSATKVMMKRDDTIMESDMVQQQAIKDNNNLVELSTKKRGKKSIAVSEQTDRFAQTTTKLQIQKMGSNKDLMGTNTKQDSP